MTTPRPLSPPVFETNTFIDRSNATFNRINDNQSRQQREQVPLVQNEWHPVLGPPYPANWKGKLPPTADATSTCFFCCDCCPADDENDIIIKYRNETQPQQQNGRVKQYDEFYGVPVQRGKYGHDFEGKKPNRPSAAASNPAVVGGVGVRNMIQEQHQQQHHRGGGGPFFGVGGVQNQLSPGFVMMNPSLLQPIMNPSASAAASNGVGGSRTTEESETQPVFSPEKQTPRVTSEPITTPNTESKQNAIVAAQQQQQQQISQQQQQQYLYGFATYIGIDVAKEPHLLPLAQQCLAAPPPAPWQPVKDPSSGRVYYANSQTQATTWDHPLLPTFKERVVQWRLHYQQQQQKQQQQQHSQVGAPSNNNSSPCSSPEQQQQPEPKRSTSNPLSKESAHGDDDEEMMTVEDPHRVKNT